jgi:hypothetical protein
VVKRGVEGWPGAIAMFQAGLSWHSNSDIEVVIGNILLEAALLEVVIDDPTLGQIGLGDLHLGFGIFCIVSDEVVVEFNFGFVSGHMLTPGYGRYGAPYSGKVEAGKKDFFN